MTQRYVLVPLELTNVTRWGIIDKVGEPFGCGYYKFSETIDPISRARSAVFFIEEKHKAVEILNGLNERNSARLAQQAIA